MVWYIMVWYVMVVNDNEFAAAVLRPSGRICDARWSGPPNPQCTLAKIPDRVRTKLRFLFL